MHIAVIGPMASGKTTCAEHLVQEMGYKRISLADPIKWVVNSLGTGGTPSDIYYRHLHPYIKPELSSEDQVKFINVISETKKIPHEEPKPRKRLQYLGTEGGREQIRDTIWIDILLGRVLAEPDQKFVVDDVRFKNELSYLHDAGFYTIKLEVDQQTQRDRIFNLYGEFDEAIFTHGSEIEIKDLEGDSYLDATLPMDTMFEELLGITRGAN